MTIPFTAMLAATPSLGKRGIKMPNVYIIKAFSPFHDHVNGFLPKINIHRTESRFVIGPSNTLFAGVYVSTFQPGHFTGWGSEGVILQNTVEYNVKEVRAAPLQCSALSCYVLHCVAQYCIRGRLSIDQFLQISMNRGIL